MELLHISASPKGERSASGGLARTFLQAYAEANPEHMIRELNVFDEAANPDFGETAAIRKFAPFYGETPSDAGEAAWARVREIIADFDRADKILLSCPMWNYSVPWALKRYLDNIVQPGISFGYNADTQQHIGLLRNRPLQFILTRSSTMAGDYVDFQLPYLRYIFDAIGIRNTRVITAAATTQPGAEARSAYLSSFADQLTQAARNF